MYILGGALLAGIFLFVYTFIDSTPHGMYGDDQAKKVYNIRIWYQARFQDTHIIVTDSKLYLLWNQIR